MPSQATIGCTLIAIRSSGLEGGEESMGRSEESQECSVSAVSRSLPAMCGCEPGCHSLGPSGENFVALHLIFCVVLDSVTFNFSVVSFDQPVYYFWFSVNKIHI